MNNLRLHRELGGGALLDLGWYCVGATLLFMQELPTKVFATAEWCNDVDTRINALLWFHNNRMATLECSFDTVRRRWLEIAGTTETLYCGDFTRPWSSSACGFHTLDGEGIRKQYDTPGAPQEECMVEAFCELIRSGQIDHPWLQLSRQTQYICEQLEQSARQNRMITLP
jgi:predicted dehydrogenase